VRFLILITNLVARIWTFSRCLIDPRLYGFHTEANYVISASPQVAPTINVQQTFAGSEGWTQAFRSTPSGSWNDGSSQNSPFWRLSRPVPRYWSTTRGHLASVYKQWNVLAAKILPRPAVRAFSAPIPWLLAAPHQETLPPFWPLLQSPNSFLSLLYKYFLLITFLVVKSLSCRTAECYNSMK